MSLLFSLVGLRGIQGNKERFSAGELERCILNLTNLGVYRSVWCWFVNGLLVQKFGSMICPIFPLLIARNYAVKSSLMPQNITTVFVNTF